MQRYPTSIIKEPPIPQTLRAVKFSQISTMLNPLSMIPFFFFFFFSWHRTRFPCFFRLFRPTTRSSCQVDLHESFINSLVSIPALLAWSMCHSSLCFYERWMAFILLLFRKSMQMYLPVPASFVSMRPSPPFLHEG